MRPSDWVSLSAALVAAVASLGGIFVTFALARGGTRRRLRSEIREDLELWRLLEPKTAEAIRLREIIDRRLAELVPDESNGKVPGRSVFDAFGFGALVWGLLTLLWLWAMNWLAAEKERLPESLWTGLTGAALLFELVVCVSVVANIAAACLSSWRRRMARNRRA